MNIQPVSCRTYNSTNQRNQKTPNFKATLVITIGKPFESQFEHFCHVIPKEVLREIPEAKDVKISTINGKKIYMWLDNTFNRKLSEVATDLEARYRRDGFPKNIIDFEVHPQKPMELMN